MEGIGKVSQWVFHLGGMSFEVNSATLVMTWLIMGLILVFTALATRGRAMVPGPWQHLSELLVSWIKDLCIDALGEQWGLYRRDLRPHAQGSRLHPRCLGALRKEELFQGAE